MESRLGVFPVPEASTSSSEKKKVALKPGRSLMDWIRLTHSGKDLTGTGNKFLMVSQHELSKHNSKSDAWISLQGKVYNITHYLEYHPGGEDELMRGAGKDATDLFNQVHKWVNAETMLKMCCVGALKKSWSFDAPDSALKALKMKYKKRAIPSENISPSLLLNPPGDDFETTYKSKWPVVTEENSCDQVSLQIKEDKNSITFKVESSNLYQAFITDLVDRMVYIKLDNFNDSKLFSVELPYHVDENYKVNIPYLEVSLAKMKTFTKSYPVRWTLCKQLDKNVYWSCKLVSKTSVNYNTNLFTFLLPAGTKMWVPVGGHVKVKSNVEGKEVVRSYTPVLPFANDANEMKNHRDGRHIVLMIKIYQTGLLTPAIDQFSPGSSLFISDYSVTISEDLLMKSDSVVMFAAGTGITPMINIIHWVLEAKDKERFLSLYFFNKTQEDILCQKELENCTKLYNKFKFVNILSQSDEKWHGLSGVINKELLKKLLPENLNGARLFICGPLSFTEVTLRYLKETHFDMDFVHAFTGS